MRAFDKTSEEWLDIKRDKVARYYYHISAVRMGQPDGKTFFYPRTADYCQARGGEEPDVARTCVSHSIAHCLAAFEVGAYDSFYIYRTSNKVKAFHPIEVDDYKVTKEKWLLHTISFVRLPQMIDADKLPKQNYYPGRADEKSLKNQVEFIQKIQRRIRNNPNIFFTVA